MLLLGGRAAAQSYSATVTAGDAPRTDDAASVSVVDLSRPERQGAGRTVSLAEVIAGEPGVTVRSSGGLGQFSGVLLRGAESSEVAILIDGVPLGGGGQAAIDLSALPVDGLERVEIYRGVPPLSLGADAIGGAINLVTRRGGDQPDIRVVAGGGSFGLRKLALSHDFSQGALRGSVSLGYQGATGDFPYYDTGGFVYNISGYTQEPRQNDGFDEGTADVRLSYVVRGCKVRASAHGILKQQGIPGIAQAQSVPAGRDPTFILSRALLSGGLEKSIGRLDLSADVHGLLERSETRELGPVVPVLTDALTGQVGGQVLARLTPHKSRQMVLLIEGRREDLRSADLCPPPLINCLNAGTTRSDRMRLSAGLSFDQHMWGDRLLFSPALQVLVAGSTFSPLAGAVGAATPLSSTSTFASPRIGTRLRLWPGVVVRASAGRFVRLPTFLELFGDGAFFRQDLTLQPESAWSLEAGTRAEGERRGLRYLVEVNGFYRLVDNLIETLRDGPTLSARNVGSARMEGVETEVRGAFRDFLSVRLSYTYLDARDQTEVTGHAGNLLPGRPQHSVFLRGDAGYGPWRAFYELDYTSLLYLDPANLDPRPERTLHGVGVQLGPYRLPGGGRYTLLAELRNLLDTRLLQVPKNLSPNGQPGFVPLGDYLDYPLPGRALYATLSAER